MNMLSCCLSELRDKEVINTCSGRRLGYVVDIEIDLCAGRLSAILLPGEGGLFTRGEDLRIPWEKIDRIGRDAILVSLTELPAIDEDKGRRKARFF